MKKEICYKCKERPSNHTCFDKEGNKRRLCCKCYIEEGNIPADWHTQCMKYYRERLEKENADNQNKSTST